MPNIYGIGCIATVTQPSAASASVCVWRMQFGWPILCMRYYYGVLKLLCTFETLGRPHHRGRRVTSRHVRGSLGWRACDGHVTPPDSSKLACPSDPRAAHLDAEACAAAAATARHASPARASTRMSFGSHEFFALDQASSHRHQATSNWQ